MLIYTQIYMERNDISTITVTRKGENNVYVKAIEIEWLRYLGFSEKEIDSGVIKLIVKADFAENKKVPFIGIGKAKDQK
jgi:hypothetical protein